MVHGALASSEELAVVALVLANLHKEVVTGSHVPRRLVVDDLQHPLAVVAVLVGLVAWVVLVLPSANMQDRTFPQHTSSALVSDRVSSCRPWES